MAEPVADLVIGDLPLIDYTDDGGWRIDARATTAGWGNPQAVDIIVRTLMQQGSSVVTDHWDNRDEGGITVAIEAQDGVALALGEAALFAEIGKRNQIIWTPPQDLAAPTVFRVITSRLTHTFDSTNEILRRREYTIVPTCEPFARSLTETVTEALGQAVDGGGTPVTPVNVLVDDCNTTTGWTALGNAQVATIGTGGNLTQRPATAFPQLKRTGSISMATTPLLVVDVWFSGDLSGLTPWVLFTSAAGSTWVAPIGSTVSPTAHFTRYYYECPYTDLTSITVGRPNIGRPMNIGTGLLALAEVRRMNNPPAEGTLRQKMFTAEVKGSAPSDGRIEIWHDTSPLGTVIVYTWQDDGPGFVPALRSRRISSGVVTADTSLISGGRDNISSTAVVYEVPASLMPSGTYELGAWIRSTTTTAVVDYAAELFQGAEERAFLTGTATIKLNAANTWEYHVIAREQLPPARVLASSTATVRVTLDATPYAGDRTVDVDEAYLFDLEHGALTVAPAGTGTRLRIEAPTLEWPMPSVLSGTLEDGSDMVDVAPSAGGVHPTIPPRMSIFAVTPGALDAHALIGQYAAWHTHAVE